MKKLGILSALLVVACAGNVYAAGANLVVAKKVSKDPVDVTSPEWSSAKEAVLINDGASGGPFEGKKLEVKVKSVYTKGGNVSVLVSWPDADQSMAKDSWKFTKGKWVKQNGDEDKLAFNWEIKRIKNFATKGCTVVCHSQSKNKEDWKYHTETATERGDIWEWKAETSGLQGYAEDGYVDDDSRKSDAGSGKAKKNEAADKKSPKFVAGARSSVPGQLVEGEAVDAKGKKGKEGEVVPGWVLSKFSGSMADVKAKSKWANGRWTVMLQRKMETGDKENDVQFDPRREFAFGLAVFNNSSRHNSYNSGPMKLKFD